MEDLNATEKSKLRRHYEKIGNLIAMWGGGVFVLLIVFSVIPMGLIPKKRRVEISDPNLTMFESLGVLPTLIMIFSISGALVLYLYFSFKYAKLKKDLEEKKKVVLHVKAKNVNYKQGPGPQEIDLYFSPSYNKVNKVTFIDEPSFPRLRKDQEVILLLTKNALHPLGIRPKTNLESIKKIWDEAVKK